LKIVDHSVYSPRAFELERERIFGRVWLFVCHESEIGNPGDFVRADICGQPLLLARDQNHKIGAFYNVCRHRGSLVVAEEKGHCTVFRCPYHWWVYSLEGKLANVPGEEAYEGTGFRKEDFGLVPVRCETLLGLVFISFDPNARPLADYLGKGVIEALSAPLARGEFEVIHTTRWPLRANWKCFAENARDGYHVPFVHPFFRAASPPREYKLLENGHALQRLGMDPAGIEPDDWASIQKFTLPGVETGDGYIVVMFPDLTITLRSNVISIDSQIALGYDQSIMEGRVLGLVGDTPEIKAARKRTWELWFNQPVLKEDKPILENQQLGLQCIGMRQSVTARGSASTTGTRGDDNRLRQFWTRWRELMGASTNSIEGLTRGA
jgi:phenylpropionate dioxygenase-like ring-hydroxylating dioxygenase large terminal subunit